MKLVEAAEHGKKWPRTARDGLRGRAIRPTILFRANYSTIFPRNIFQERGVGKRAAKNQNNMYVLFFLLAEWLYVWVGDHVSLQ